MSTFAKRIRNGILFAIFLLACAGLLGLFLGQSKKPEEPVFPLRLEDQLALSGELPTTHPVIDQPYQIIQPTVGLLQETLPVTFSKTEEDQATIHRTDSRIQQMMPVILYDDRNQALPKKGFIISVSDQEAVLSLPKAKTQATHAEIILAENFMARRLPNSTRLDKSVWKAIPMSDGSFMAKRIVIERPAMRNNDYFEITPDVRTDEYAVANPDQNLKDGAILTTVALIRSDAPTLDPQQIAEQKDAEEYVERLLYSIRMTPPPPELNPPGNACPLPALIPVRQ